MHAPGATVVLDGRRFRVVEVLKEDRYARTTLLSPLEAVPGLPAGRRCTWKESIVRLPPGIAVPRAAALLARHEASVLEALAGCPGIPRLLGRPGPCDLLREFIEGATLRDTPAPPPGFFASFERALAAVHARGVAVVDLAKEENVLVAKDGSAWLVDFQVALRREGPFRALVPRFQREDLYHLSKMRLRRAPGEATDEDRRRTARRGALGRLHRATVKRAYNLLTRHLVKRWSGAGEGRPGSGRRA
jgi:hypothetical protein